MFIYEKSLSGDELRKLSPDEQYDYLLSWFHAKYEDPANSLPYESAEGGYQWILGGPYDAREVLSDFEGIVSEEVLEKAIKELENECWDWSPIPTDDDYDRDLIRDIRSISEYCHTFHGAMLDIEKLLEITPGPAVEQLYYRLLFANLITAMETYLQDAFLNTILHNKKYLRNFIENLEAHKKEKIPLSDLYKEVDDIPGRVIRIAGKTMWHNLKNVKGIYKATFNLEFPDNLEKLESDIKTRHDIVHRNGKSKDGKEIPMFKSDIEALKQRIESFVHDIDNQLPKKDEELRIEL